MKQHYTLKSVGLVVARATTELRGPEFVSRVGYWIFHSINIPIKFMGMFNAFTYNRYYSFMPYSRIL